MPFLVCKRMRGVEGPALLLGMFSVAVCGKMPCVYSCVQADVEETRNRRDYVRLATKSGADRCDYCAVYYRGQRVHRCSRCLTKVYCGEQCRDQDWGVHKLVCREGEGWQVGRKMKRKKGRKQRIREEVIRFSEY